MESGQARRILRRILHGVRREIGDAGATDPLTGELFGSLNEREAVASGRVVLGPRTYGSFTVHIGRNERARVHIGAYCSIALGVEFSIGGNHRPEWISTYPFRVEMGMPDPWTDQHIRTERDIRIGNDVWIGRQALILPGIQIGDGAVIGARAVVSKDVRPYAVAVGVPASEVRRRFTDEQVEALLGLRWWDWPEQKVREHVDLLSSGDVERLLAVAHAGASSDLRRS
jgi:acetyltransferase-like isoleucine patch superfamily enzyme